MAVAVGMDTAVYGSTTVSTRYTIRATQSGRQLRKETPDWGGKLKQYHSARSASNHNLQIVPDAPYRKCGTAVLTAAAVNFTQHHSISSSRGRCMN